MQAVTPKREEPQEDEPVDEKKTQKMLLLAGGIALAAVIVFALWNVIMGSFRKEPVQTEFTVPNLLGMTIEEAEARRAGEGHLHHYGDGQPREQRVRGGSDR